MEENFEQHVEEHVEKACGKTLRESMSKSTLRKHVVGHLEKACGRLLLESMEESNSFTWVDLIAAESYAIFNEHALAVLVTVETSTRATNTAYSK